MAKSKKTPATPSKKEEGKDTPTTPHHVEDEKKSSQTQEKRKPVSLLASIVSLVVVPLVVVTMVIIAVANVNYLVHGNNATTRWLNVELERGLKEPLVDRALQLQDVSHFVTACTTSIHDLLTKNGVDESYLAVLHKIPTMVPQGEIPVHVTVHTKDIPFLTILATFALVMLSSPLRLVLAICARRRLDNTNPRTMFRKLSEKSGIVARAQAAHENSIEALLFLVSAVVVAFTGTDAVDQVLLAKLCIIYIVARIVYHFVYVLASIAILGALRSLVFFHGIAALLLIFVMPVQHVLSCTTTAAAAAAAAAAASASGAL